MISRVRSCSLRIASGRKDCPLSEAAVVPTLSLRSFLVHYVTIRGGWELDYAPSPLVLPENDLIKGNLMIRQRTLLFAT